MTKIISITKVTQDVGVNLIFDIVIDEKPIMPCRSVFYTFGRTMVAVNIFMGLPSSFLQNFLNLLSGNRKLIDMFVEPLAKILFNFIN